MSETAEPAAKKARVDEGVPIDQVALKVVSHLGEPKKFEKALKLLHKIVAEQLCADTVEALKPPIQAAIEMLHGPISDSNRAPVADFVKLLEAKRDILFPDRQDELESLLFEFVRCEELRTDDSYVFNKTMRSFMPLFDTLTPETPPHRKHALFRILRNSIGFVKQMWAKTSVELMFKVAAEKRHCFEAAQVAIIESWVTSLKKKAAPKEISSDKYIEEQRKI